MTVGNGKLPEQASDVRTDTATHLAMAASTKAFVDQFGVGGRHAIVWHLLTQQLPGVDLINLAKGLTISDAAPMTLLPTIMDELRTEANRIEGVYREWLRKQQQAIRGGSPKLDG